MTDPGEPPSPCLVIMRRANGPRGRKGKHCRPSTSQYTYARRAKISLVADGDTMHIWALEGPMIAFTISVWPPQGGIPIPSNTTGDVFGGGRPSNAM